MTPHDAMLRIDALAAHLWMVRAFLKHAPETEDDEQLAEVHRGLYDFMLALGPAWSAQDAAEYLKMVRKKRRRLEDARTLLVEIQPEVSTHTNFQMAVRSLNAAAADIEAVLASVEDTNPPPHASPAKD